VPRDHVEVTRLWGMVGCLLRDVVGLGVVGELPVAGVYFAEDGV
jgi:hypothetical protein